MQKFLLSLLALSLVVNAWLLWGSDTVALARSRPAATASTTARAGRSAGPDTAAAANNTTTPFVWTPPGTTNADLGALAGRLRAAGFPPLAISKIVGALLRERTFAEVAKRPYWQLINSGTETRRMMSAATTELLQQQEEILGPSGSPAATLDPLDRLQRYGSLSDEKINALLRIKRDYDDLQANLAGSQRSFTSEEAKARAEQARSLEKERQADIAAALSPEELAEYELHGSGPAKAVMAALNDITVTEEEYRALFQLQKSLDPTGTTGGMLNLDSFSQQLPERYAMQEKMLTLLGEERFGSYLKASDYNYAQAARFTETYSSLPKTAAYQLYQLQNEVQAASSKMSEKLRTNSGDTATVEEAQKTFSALNTRLETLLGTEAAGAYRKQGMGTLFNNWTPRPQSSGAGRARQ